MRGKTVATLALAILSPGLLLGLARRTATPMAIECGSLDLPKRHVLIRIPANPAGLTVNVTVAPASARPDGSHWTTLRAQAGGDSLSCHASDPASFILDLTEATGASVRLAVETDQDIEFRALTSTGEARGGMGLAPGASGIFRW